MKNNKEALIELLTEIRRQLIEEPENRVYSIKDIKVKVAIIDLINKMVLDDNTHRMAFYCLMLFLCKGHPSLYEELTRQMYANKH